MRYALSTSPQRTTWSWLADVWDRADDHEVFESAWTFDHFYPLFGDSSEDCLEGWVTLTALLARTRRVRGGVLVSGMVYRHPGLLANMAATLDHTSDGRLELGVGAGWNEEECSAYGLELGSMRERFDRFAEGLEVIESLLTQERTTFQGRWYQLNDAMCWPKPVQPRLPLCMGGRGRTRTVPLAGRFAQHWNYSGSDPAEFADLRGVLAEHAAVHGRDVADITCSAIVRYAGDAAALRHDVAAFAAVGVDLSIVSVPKDAPASVVHDIAAALPSEA
jgi:F420-dependent oxidoreductase-like protein